MFSLPPLLLLPACLPACSRGDSLACCHCGCVCSFLANLRRKRKISPKMQFVMWFAGLRGAIAFALAMNMPNVEGNLWDNDVIVTTTLISAWPLHAVTQRRCGCVHLVAASHGEESLCCVACAWCTQSSSSQPWCAVV